MTRRLVVVAGLMVSVLLCGAVVLAARPDLRNNVRYRLTADDIGAPEVLSTLPPTPTSLPRPVHLAAAGDAGTGDDAELRTAAAIDELETDAEYDALLLLGDNVYPNGDPAELQRVVFDPFAGVLDGPTRLLPVLGNHDVSDGNGDAQAAAIGMPKRWYATTIDDVLVLSLDSTLPDDTEQLAWLESTLEHTDATWIVATMHHPPYSGGYHGSSLDVRSAFSPLFERYGVQVAPGRRMMRTCRKCHLPLSLTGRRAAVAAPCG